MAGARNRHNAVRQIAREEGEDQLREFLRRKLRENAGEVSATAAAIDVSRPFL